MKGRKPQVLAYTLGFKHTLLPSGSAGYWLVPVHLNTCYIKTKSHLPLQYRKFYSNNCGIREMLRWQTGWHSGAVVNTAASQWAFLCGTYMFFLYMCSFPLSTLVSSHSPKARMTKLLSSVNVSLCQPCDSLMTPTSLQMSAGIRSSPPQRPHRQKRDEKSPQITSK